MSDCGCCSTPAALVPGDIQNRPWLSAITYRVGTFATFRKAILDELSRTPALAQLTSRVGDDYTITIVELWAAVADVLTFYQERIANEAFLRTATYRDPLLRLVRLIDYQLGAGAAATAEVAFTLETGASASIAPRTRIQSVPGEGETPQKFETLVPLLARAVLNSLRIQPGPVPLPPTALGMAAATAAPDTQALAAASALARGDRVLLYAPAAVEVLTVKDVQTRDDQFSIKWSGPIGTASFAAAFDAANPDVRAFKLGRSFHLFGFDAPASTVVPDKETVGGLTRYFLTLAPTDFTLHGDGTGATQISLDGRYDGLRPGSVLLAVSAPIAGPLKAIPFRVAAVTETRVKRDATTPKGNKVEAQSGTVTQVTLAAAGSQSLANLIVAPADIRDVVVYELLGDPLRFWPFAHDPTLMSGQVFLPGRRAGWTTVEVGRTIEKGIYKGGTLLDAADFETGRRVLLTDGKPLKTPVGASVINATLAGTNVEFAPAGNDPTLGNIGLSGDVAIPLTILASRRSGPAVTFPNARHELTVTIGSFPPQTIVLAGALTGAVPIAAVAAATQAAIRAALPGAPTFARALVWPVDNALAIAAGIPGDRIQFAASLNDPSTIDALGLAPAAVSFLDGVLSGPIAPILGTSASGMVNVTHDVLPAVDLPITVTISSVATLAAALSAAFDVQTAVTTDDRLIVLPKLPVWAPRAYLRLTLSVDDPFSLDAATAGLLGNVVAASHGETVPNEILGDGDASQTFQRFTFRKKPVTYTPAPVPGGVVSSVELFVDGVRWTEVPTLYDAAPRDQVFVTRVADDGTLTAQFGDGLTGARVTTGRENVTARYRHDTGLAGRVRAGALTTLLDRATGVKGVTNPKPSDGGADPETMVRARQAAPGTVRTFGRAVALRDFEDSALTAGEVVKSLATWVWAGERRAIHLTVAAQGGVGFSGEGLGRILATLDAERDPNHKLLIDNYTPVAVVVDASLLVDDRHVRTSVLDAARRVLLHSLSFDERRFAQPVYLSDIVSVLQHVEGVGAVDVNALDLKSSDPAFRAAHGIDASLGRLQPRLLMLPPRPGGAPNVVLAAELAWVEVPGQDVTLTATGGIDL